MKKFYHKYNRKTWLVLVFTIIIALVSLKFLPSQLPIHFDTQGNPDNFAGKWSIFLAPFIILLLIFLAEILRDVDPKSKNYIKFEKYYYYIHFAVALLMLFIQLYTIIYVLGWKIKINQLIFPIIALLLIFLGNILPKIKHNYFIGIRNSWTITSERVWYLTHRFVGKLFVFSGFFLMLISFFLNKYISIFYLFTIIILVLLSFVASYYYYQKNEEDFK